LHMDRKEGLLTNVATKSKLNAATLNLSEDNLRGGEKEKATMGLSIIWIIGFSAVEKGGGGDNHRERKRRCLEEEGGISDAGVL